MGSGYPPEGDHPPQSLADWVHQQTGPVRLWERTRPTSSPSRVWRVQTAQGAAWLKVHSQPRKYRQEVRGLLGLGADLRQHGVPTPELWAHQEAECALLIGHVTGSPAARHCAEPAAATRIFQQAGRIAQIVHSRTLDDPDEMPLSEALGRRAQAWSARTHGLLTDGQRAAMLEHCTSHHFEGATRSWCHRDFSTRNWLVDGTGTLAVIDFEHVHPDLWLTDLPRPTVDRMDWPTCEAAFLEGYGRPMTDQECDWRSRLHGFLALTSLAWGLEHKDTALCKRAHLWLAHHPQWSGSS